MQKTVTLKGLVKLTEKQGNIEGVKQEYVPSAMVISNILNYSRALSVRRTKTLGSVDMVLN